MFNEARPCFADREPSVRLDSGQRLLDLHIHSNFSDGRLDVAAIVSMAAAAGLSGIALTDHDTVDGLLPARISAEQAGLRFVPGIELNTDWEDEEVHILGYFIDPLNEYLLSRLDELRQKRRLRARRIVEKLGRLGLPLDFDRVQELAGGGLIGRPHVARAMVEQGYASQESEAFQRFIGRGQPAFVPRYNFTPQEALELISSSGGLAFLAHPGKINDKSVIYRLIADGITGLEVYYPEHDEGDIRFLLGLADRYHLLISGGSDFHGPGSGEKRETLGLSGIDENDFQRILEYLRGKPD